MNARFVCGFDDLRKIFVFFCLKHQMFLNVWFRFGDKLRHDELRRVSVHGFAQFSEAMKVVFEAKCEAIDRFCNAKRRRCTSGGSANVDFKACLKLSSFWRGVVSSVNLVFSIDNTEFGHSPTHACCSKVSLVAACKWVV